MNIGTNALSPRISKSWFYLGRELLSLANGRHSLLVLCDDSAISKRFMWWCDGRAVMFNLPMSALYLEIDNSDRFRDWYLRPVIQTWRKSDETPYDNIKIAAIATGKRYSEDRIK